MSYSLLHRLVQDELARNPSVVAGRVESVDDDGGLTMNFHGQSENAHKIRATGMQIVAPQDTGFVLHLGEYRRPVFWLPSNVNVGGQASEV